MDFSNVPIFDMLRRRMEWLTERQAVLADNIANSDTPEFTAKDVAALDFEKELVSATKMHVTNTRHLVGTGVAGHNASIIDSPDSEASPNGNSVVLEDQMIKVSDTQFDYAASVNLYKKALGLIRMAVSGRAG
jgi:flagellar basal-body rod protein FlgB